MLVRLYAISGKLSTQIMHIDEFVVVRVFNLTFVSYTRYTAVFLPNASLAWDGLEYQFNIHNVILSTVKFAEKSQIFYFNAPILKILKLSTF